MASLCESKKPSSRFICQRSSEVTRGPEPFLFRNLSSITVFHCGKGRKYGGSFINFWSFHQKVTHVTSWPAQVIWGYLNSRRCEVWFSPYAQKYRKSRNSKVAMSIVAVRKLYNLRVRLFLCERVLNLFKSKQKDHTWRKMQWKNVVLPKKCIWL